MTKSQITNPKFQTITKLQDRNFLTDSWDLAIEYCLVTGAWHLEFCRTG